MTVTAPDTFPGMGALVHDGGCTFRVWAPHATAISVVGERAPLTAPAVMEREPSNGDYWSCFVPGVGVGAQYRYQITNNGNVFTRIDPRGRDSTSSAGQSVVCDPDFDWSGDSFIIPAWNELVIYELHVGTFNSPGNGAEGTLESAIQRIGQLADLGINAIQIMPVNEFDNDRSLGYNPALPYSIESAYGTDQAFQQLVKAAHLNGIAVIIDVVFNHWGEDGLADCLWQFDGWSKYGGDGGIFFYNEDENKWTPWGDRPNYSDGDVRQFLCDNALLWLETYRVDGLRWDSTGCVRMNKGLCNDGGCCGNDLADGWSLMQWINDQVAGRQPGKIVIAEDLHDNQAITSRTAFGGAGFNSQWDPTFLHNVRDQVTAQFDSGRDMFAVAGAIVHRYHLDACERVIFVESHNEAGSGRLTEVIWRGDAVNWFARKRSTLAAGIVFTSPGIPMFFQGDEMLAWGNWSENDMLDWSLADRFAGIRAMYQAMIRLRRNWFNNTRGLQGQSVNVFHVNNDQKVIAYHRYADGGPGDDVIIVANFSDQSFGNYNVGFPRGGLWYCRFNGDAQLFSGDFGNFGGYDTTANWGYNQGMPYNADVGVGPYSVVIFSQ